MHILAPERVCCAHLYRLRLNPLVSASCYLFSTLLLRLSSGAYARRLCHEEGECVRDASGYSIAMRRQRNVRRVGRQEEEERDGGVLSELAAGLNMSQHDGGAFLCGIPLRRSDWVTLDVGVEIECGGMEAWRIRVLTEPNMCWWRVEERRREPATACRTEPAPLNTTQRDSCNFIHLHIGMYYSAIMTYMERAFLFSCAGEKRSLRSSATLRRVTCSSLVPNLHAHCDPDMAQPDQ